VRLWALSLAAAAVLVLAATGCGGSGDEDVGTTSTPSDPTALTGAERDALADDEASILEYCRARALSLTNPDKRPTVGQQARALEAVDALVALAAEKPAARVERQVDLGLYLGDLAENLEGSNCDPQIVARLEQGLAQVATGP
jgi:hypothetical protein